jgi:hypothetical protein
VGPDRQELATVGVTAAPGILGVFTELDRMKGEPYRFMGANKVQRMFRLKDDEGNDYYFAVKTVDGNKIAAIARIELPDPAPVGLTRDEPLGTVMIYEYNKQDNLYAAQPLGQEFSQAQWNKGYQLIDQKHGHPWLRIGVHNYRNRPRVKFEYNYVGDDDDEEG